MLYTNLISGIVVLVLGLIIQTGKANFLIAGYNTMSKAEKEKWDAKAISKFTGWWMLVIPSMILLISCIPLAFDFFPNEVVYVSWTLFTLVIIGGVIYVNRSSRFKRTVEWP